jgi:hypothetical protein
MLKVAIHRVQPEKEQQLRDWLAELMRRQDEVRETFAQETVRHEQAYLLATSDEPMLVYAMEAADFERGRAAFLNSTLAIDSEHKQVMRDVLAGPAPAELLYDCTV